MKVSLIGTGFVGYNIFHQADEGIDLYNTSNIAGLYGKEYDLVIVAAPGGSKFVANKFPDEDRFGVGAIVTYLNSAKGIKKVVLISTIEVYSDKNKIDESGEIDESQLDDYGRSRRLLEKTIIEEYGNPLIIRLPILFGENLKKNFIYDLIHNERLEYINPDDELPVYNLEYLWNDILTCLDCEIDVVNMVSEPTKIDEITKEIFNIELSKNESLPLRKYDIRSKHAHLWGPEHYMESKKEMMYDLLKFVEKQNG